MRKIRQLTNGTQAMQMDSKAKSSTNKIYNLAAGDPIGEPVSIVKDGFLKTISFGWWNHYGNAQGSLALRKLLYKNPDQVLISNGAKGLMYLALLATCDPGDSVLIIGPCWSSYLQICKILKLNIIQYIPDYEKDGWKNNINDIAVLFEENISVVIFTNPNNPTGVTEGKFFVDELVKLCEEYDCWLLSDEIYDKLVYSGEFESALDKSNLVIYLNGFSKNCGIPGWRVGYCIADEKLIHQMTMLQSQISGPPNTFFQKVMENTLEEKKIGRFVAIKNNYEEIVNYLSSLSITFNKYKPDGGFYFYLPVKNTKETCEYLAKHSIIVVPGDDYGVENTIRLSFASITLNDLKEIEKYLKEI